MIPNDPAILLSFVNTKLRDFYATLDDLCDDLDINSEDLKAKLNSIGYIYDEGKNRFI